jgi:hypothetical protein
MVNVFTNLLFRESSLLHDRPSFLLKLWLKTFQLSTWHGLTSWGQVTGDKPSGRKPSGRKPGGKPPYVVLIERTDANGETENRFCQHEQTAWCEFGFDFSSISFGISNYTQTTPERLCLPQ